MNALKIWLLGVIAITSLGTAVHTGNIMKRLNQPNPELEVLRIIESNTFRADQAQQAIRRSLSVEPLGADVGSPDGDEGR